jgi:hypothetical protein
LTRVAGENVGEYAINQGGVTLGSNYSLSYVGAKLLITPAAACVTYNGDMFKNTSSTTTGGTANVTLSVVVVKNPKTTLEDLRTANVKFLISNNGTTWTTLNPANVTVNSTGTQVIYSGIYPLSLGSNLLSDTWDVKWTLNGNYVQDNNCSDVGSQITLSALAADFATGGGYVMNTGSTGTVGVNGGTATKNNFGFNVKWNKSMSTLQGHFNTIIRVGSRVYQVKSNKPSYLSVGTDKKSATVNYSNAVLQEVSSIVNGVCTNSRTESCRQRRAGYFRSDFNNC